MMKIRIASVVLAASLVLVGCEREPVVYQENQTIIIDGVRLDQSTNEPITGVVEAFHENGQLERRTNFVDGLLEGLDESFRENGQLWLRVNYVDGQREGLQEQFHSNGQLWLRLNWVDDQREGLSEDFYRNGQLHFRSNYVDGQFLNAECWTDSGTPRNC